MTGMSQFSARTMDAPFWSVIASMTLTRCMGHRNGPQCMEVRIDSVRYSSMYSFQTKMSLPIFNDTCIFYSSVDACAVLSFFLVGLMRYLNNTFLYGAAYSP